ncbi:hypothetical protein THOM_1947 [Trachipleistophora hominis]|uniref:Uncharacterized protein n=1 Tax=Trachipleistophora hominis TaxID=72359 RepID=L7JUF6_TRAHO|nr:hypothetical protein THOM_1947 [Trachipleistophora hominis]
MMLNVLPFISFLRFTLQTNDDTCKDVINTKFNMREAKESTCNNKISETDANIPNCEAEKCECGYKQQPIDSLVEFPFHLVSKCVLEDERALSMTKKLQKSFNSRVAEYCTEVFSECNRRLSGAYQRFTSWTEDLNTLRRKGLKELLKSFIKACAKGSRTLLQAPTKCTDYSWRGRTKMPIHGAESSSKKDKCIQAEENDIKTTLQQDSEDGSFTYNYEEAYPPWWYEQLKNAMEDSMYNPIGIGTNKKVDDQKTCENVKAESTEEENTKKNMNTYTKFKVAAGIFLVVFCCLLMVYIGYGIYSRWFK